ncbi:MAG TPA: glycoside hydrolase family 28 protein [Burkholderiaceae bacterium]
MHTVSAAGLSLAGGMSFVAFSTQAAQAASAAASDDPWQRAQDIAVRLSHMPAFRDEDFLITAYGAKTCKLEKRTGWLSLHDKAELDTPVAGAHDCYPAIAAAIAACHKAGGGRVLIPAGNWLCAGPIVLLSNVHVHLQAGAQVWFSNNPADYAKYGDYDCGKNGKLVRARWQGNDCLNFCSMVYAHSQENIALTGEDWTSILNGQGGTPFVSGGDECWWAWKGKLGGGAKTGRSEVAPNPANPATLADVAPNLHTDQIKLIEGDSQRWRTDFGYLPALSEAGVPPEKRIFGLGHYLRPNMIQFIACNNVWMEGYQVTNTPFWQHNPVACRNMTVRRVHANSLGPNNDGFDPESCTDVLIDTCTFNTGDDCIAIKAGKDLDIQHGPTKNVVIQHCTMHSGHGAVTLGSEMAGGIEDVFAQDLVFQNANWATNPLNMAIRLKSNMNRGGYLKNFYARNISVPNGVRTEPGFYKPLPGMPIAADSVASTAGAVVIIDCDYAPAEDNVRVRPPAVSNVHISNVTVGNVAKSGGQYSSYQAVVVLGPVAAEYNGAKPAPAVVPVHNVTIADCDFGTPAASGSPFFVFNARDIKLENVKIGGKVFNTTLAST